jgi:putative sigma-54 modulation protein
MVDKSKFDGEGYKVHIVGKNVFVTEGMKNYALDKIHKLERFHDHIMDVQIVLDIQNVEHIAAIVMKFDHFKIKVSADSTDMYVSIDKAMSRIESKVRRWKSRIQDHSKKKLTAVDMRVNVLGRLYKEEDEYNAEIEALNKQQEAFEHGIPQVIGKETLPLKTLRTEEAIMKLDLSENNFLIFRDEADQKLKVMYRRSDRNFGVIQPE